MSSTPVALKPWLSTLVALLLLGPATASAAVFHVAPDGNDAAPGTPATPFATLTRARDAARQTEAGQARRIVVHGGLFTNASLLLEPADSGLVIEAASGETPVLAGGQTLQGWVPDGEHFFSAPLPNPPPPQGQAEGRSLGGGWQVRLLLVNGASRPRARFPEEGQLGHTTTFDVPWMSSTGGGWKRPPTPEELTTLRYAPGVVPTNLSTANAEITVFHMWDESCVGVASHDPAQGLLQLAPPCGHPPGAFGVKKFTLWNIREGMTRPGQWYHDRERGRIVYWPLPGEDMTRLQVLVPTRGTILRIRGTRANPVEDVQVRGLTLTCTTVPLLAGGFGASAFDGAISLDQTRRCLLENLTVREVAGHGVNAYRGAEETTVRRCEVTGCGAGGLYVGGRKATLRDNHVHRVGVSYPSAIGIFRGGDDCLVAHNEVHDCSYSAINYGGRRNVIEGNLIYDCMKVLHDGAAIYLFAAVDCVIRGNLARDIIDTGGYGASAYYLDERSTNCVVEGNLSLRVGWPTHNHMATNNIIRNNVFLVTGDAKLTFPRSTGYVFEHNIIQATGGIRIEGVNAIAQWAGNLFHPANGKVELVEMQQYSRRATREGLPGDTVLRDPMFNDAEHGNFGFREGSPAPGLGIQPIDVTQAGPSRGR